MDDVLNHSRQRWRLQLPRGSDVVSQTAGSRRAYDDGMGGSRGGGGQAGPEARCGGDWAASGVRMGTVFGGGRENPEAAAESSVAAEEVLGALSVTNALDWLGPSLVDRCAP